MIKKEIIIFQKQPSELQEKYRNQQQELDSNTLLVFNTFNQFLNKNNRESINYKTFRQTLNIYFSQLINKEPMESTECSKLLIEWIKLIYKNKECAKLISVFDKIIFSWLLFSYFYSVKRSKRKLSNKVVVFDTNLIVYLLGINGIERQYFVEYLLSKLKENKCSIMINDFTIKEFQTLLETKDNIEIIRFIKQNPDTISQLKYNIEEYLINKFKNQYGIDLCINTKKNQVSNELTKDMISQLKNYKSNGATWNSAEHDIKLIFSSGVLTKISNIYNAKMLITTCDSRLRNWYSSYMKRQFNSDYINLLTLDIISLIFWIETDKCQDSGFLMNTWMSISDSISYFKNKRIDMFFSTVEEKYKQEKCLPENWRSVYLLIKDNLPENKSIDEINDNDLLDMLDRISSIDATENYELLIEINDMKNQLSLTKEKLSESENEITQLKLENKQPTIILNQNDKKPDDFSIFELIIAIIKKIFKFRK